MNINLHKFLSLVVGGRGAGEQGRGVGRQGVWGGEAGDSGRGFLYVSVLYIYNICMYFK